MLPSQAALLRKKRTRLALATGAGLGEDGAQVSSCGIEADAQRFGGLLQRQAMGQLDHQRGLRRRELKQLLGQMRGRIGLAIGVAHEHRDAGTTLGLCFSSEEMLCTTSPQLS